MSARLLCFVGTLLGEKKFRYAGEVAAGLSDAADPKSGQVSNGGFESIVKPTGAGPFEWIIAPGLQPQIVLTNGQKHGGSNSLLIVFNSSDSKDFRTVSQLIAVQPNTSYEFEIFYRAELKTQALFKWEVADAADDKTIALSDPISNTVQWLPLLLKFKSPPTSDGVILRLTRENCSQICPVAGSIGFDDISLRSVSAP